MIGAIVRPFGDPAVGVVVAATCEPGTEIPHHKPMVEIKSLRKRYGCHEVVRGCDLVIFRGELVVICGPSGSSKSTLIKRMNGLEKFDSGSVVVDGVAVGKSNFEMTRLRARRQPLPGFSANFSLHHFTSTCAGSP